MRVDVCLQSPVLADSEVFARTARALLEAVAYVNQTTIATVGAPGLYESGVVYLREPPGVEQFVGLEIVLERGGGDCAQLAAWLVAQRRAEGKRSDFRLIWRELPNGRRIFHVQVRTNGKIEDPSVRLGMPPFE